VPLAGYLAAAGFVTELQYELADAVVATHGRLVLAEGPVRPAAWAANVWLDPREIEISSIGDAAKRLRALQRNWALYSHAHHRRAALIAEKLPKVSAKPIRFGAAPPAAPLGSWTLLAPNLLLAAPNCSSPVRHGEWRFVEDRKAPPNRAYLKLWEVFTRIGRQPRAGELCLDLGSSPGGWSWVLQNLGARVISVDKAPLAPAVAALPNIEFRRGSAFALDPRQFEGIDWLFSDVVCYPERLYRLVETWLAAGTKRFVCALKFQGATDHETACRFAAIPGSRLMHLHHNKHELTWIKLD